MWYDDILSEENLISYLKEINKLRYRIFSIFWLKIEDIMK